MEKFTFFWKSGSPFSQWHMSSFTVEGVRFTCAEQFMMYKKAELFGDKTAMGKILEATTPYEHKGLGRKVKNFVESTWNQKCKDFVYEGNYHKFTQNKHLLSQLLSTKGTTLVEASPKDTIWGIGLEAHDPRAHDRTEWLGTNWLGEVLTQLRDDLLEDTYK